MRITKAITGWMLKLPHKRRGALPSGPPARPGKKPARKTVLILAAVLVLAAGGTAGAFALFRSDERTALTETLAWGSLSSSITGTGVTTPVESQTVTVASTAEILSVYVSPGDTVEAGDLLYEQDDSELDDEIDEYKDEIATLEDDLLSSQEQLSDVRESLSGLTVTAPFSGHISAITAEEGEDIPSGTQLAVLVDDTQMKLTQYFSYAYEEQVYVGMSAGVSIADQMLNLTGTVTAVHKVERLSSEGTPCFAVTVTVDNPGSLTEGTAAAGYLLTASGEKLYPAIEGELEYRDSRTLSAEVSAELLTIAVENYEAVTTGQTLFVLDGSDLQTELTTLTDRIEQTQERIRSYEERIEEAEASRDDFAVRAEISGQVIQVGISAGERPRSESTAAVVIYNLDTMEITVNIDELDIDAISPGTEAVVTRSGSDSTEDQVFTGSVSEISYEATNSDGVAYFPIVIEIPAAGALSAGVNVSYSIQVGEDAEGVLAPISALRSTSEGTCLLIQADSEPENAVSLEEEDLPKGFYAVPVEVGQSNSQYVCILSGAEEGDVVFTRYETSAPAGGDTQSSGGESEAQSGSFPGGMDFGGGMPMGGGMPSGGPMR